MSREEFKPVLGYEGLYEVSNTGKIRSLFRYKKELKPHISNTGYERVELFKNKTGKWFSVHRLVAEAFCVHPKGYDEVNHKDECKTNNNANNLEWVTSAYNNVYGTRLKRMVENTDYTKRRINNENQIKACSKPISQYTKEGVFIRDWKSASECHRATGIDIAHIRGVCLGKRKTAKGYIFRDKEE